MFKVQLKLDKGVEAPKYGSAGAAAVDLVANISEPLTIGAGEVVSVPTGVYVSMVNEPQLCAIALPRSGLGSKGLVLANTIGLIDNDYQGEVRLNLFNRNPSVVKAGMGFEVGKSITIEPGMRVAQLMFTSFIPVDFEQVEEFEEQTERGEGGFGSTGE